ncbi:hypothetical protein ACFWW5_00585 [Streptomyces albidoflavus]
MARRMVGDNQDVYRVVVTQRTSRDNPNWVRGEIRPDNPRFLWDGPEWEQAYGPYNSIGAARGRLTTLTTDIDGSTPPGVTGGRIEKAHTTWEEVQ